MGLGQPLLKIIGEINYISGPDAYWEPALATSLNVWKLLLSFFLCPFLDSVRVTFIFSSGVGQLTHWEDEEKWWTQYCFFLWIVKLNSVVAMASSKAAGDVCQVKSPPVGTHPVPVSSSVVEFSALLVMGIPGVMGGVLQGGESCEHRYSTSMWSWKKFQPKYWNQGTDILWLEGSAQALIWASMSHLFIVLLDALLTFWSAQDGWRWV